MTITLLYHPGTGTVINPNECVLVDVPEGVEFTGDDYIDGPIVDQLADEIGRPVPTHVINSDWAERLGALGILDQVEQFIEQLCVHLDIDPNADPF